MLEYKLLGYAPIFDHAESDKAIIFELKDCFLSHLMILSATWPSGSLPRAGDRSYVTGLIHSWSRSHLTCMHNGRLLTRRAQAHFAVSLNYC